MTSGFQHQFCLPPRNQQARTHQRQTASCPRTAVRKTILKCALRFLFLLPTCVAAPLAPQTAGASIVTWNVDPAVSYLRLTIPDQTVDVPDVGTATLMIRDAASTAQWSDTAGRRAALDGEIVTDYTDGVSISFLAGSNNLYALKTTSLRPNPAEWNAATATYSGSSTALAALGGRVRGTFLLTFDAAYFAFRNIRFEISNASSRPIGITNGAFAARTTRCGIPAPLVDVDGLALPLGLGQPIPDQLQGPMDPVVVQNAAGATIANVGGLNRKLTYTINLPSFSLNLNGTIVNGSAAGQIVAYGAIPAPPPTLSLRCQGSHLVLAWPTNATGFSLVCATNLLATNWIAASPLPVIVNGENVVTNTLTNRALFYRLRKP